MPLADQVVFSVTMLLIGVLMWFLPVMKGQDAFFGIPVSTEFYRSRRARAFLRWYRTIVGLLVGAPLGFLLSAGAEARLGPGLVLGLVLVAALGPLVPLIAFWYVVRPYEVVRSAADLPVSGEPPSKWTYVTPLVEAVLLVILLMTVAVAMWRYPQLPERIPTHWNAAGQADGWHPKSPLLLLSIVLMMGYMHVVFLWLLVGLAEVPERLPAERTEEYRGARERYMWMWARFFNVMRGTILVIFVGIVWASVSGIEEQVTGTVPPGMIVVFLGTAGLLLSLPWVIVKALRLRGQMREIAGPGTMESIAPTEGWIAGAIYYNKSDPAVWVEKRVGIGWTLNFAHPSSWAFMAFVFLVPVAIAVMALVGVAK